jgi:phosphoserine phosphatase RsbU/P
MMNIKKSALLKIIKPFMSLFAIIIFSYLLYEFAHHIQQSFSRLVSVATYLTWHNVFEFVGIIVCFAIFMVSYYTYDQTGRLRTIFLGSSLLIVGLLDLFHTLSYKGMPDFIISNGTSNRATTLWIIARLIAAGCFLTASLISVKRTSTVNKHLFVIPSILISFVILVIVTYHPGLLPYMYIEGSGLTRVKIGLEFVVMLLLFLTALIYLFSYKKTKDYLSVLMCGAIILGIFSEYAFVKYNQVYDIYNYIGHIYKFISYFIIFRVIFVRNVQQPYFELSAAQKELRDHADNLDKVVDQRTRQLKQMNRKLLDDLEYARDIQKAMLPTIMPDTRDVTFSARYFPAERLSGDFYDIFRLDDNHIGLYICDVSGHGVPAAMLTVFLKQCMETRREIDLNSGSISLPSSVLHGIYESFNHTNFKDDVFIVLVYAVYDVVSKKLTYSSAGINVSPILISNEGEVKDIDISGFPICKFKEIFTVEYTDSILELNSGDRLFFYTDGLVEADNREKQQYSVERLHQLIGVTVDKTSEELNKAIIDDLFGFTDGKKIRDDITFFIMEIT